MKKIQLAAVALVAIAAGAAQAQVSVGAAININVPGVYGRVDIGAPGPAFAPPPVVYEQPVIIAPSPVAIHQRPIYLYVPDAYQRDWRHHCGAYGACGQPVFFVKEQWVHDRYVQHYPHDHRFDNWHGYGPGEHREAVEHERHEVEREHHEEHRDDHGHDDHGHDDHGHDHDHDRR
jgi:hypothetical protein